MEGEKEHQGQVTVEGSQPRVASASSLEDPCDAGSWDWGLGAPNPPRRLTQIQATSVTDFGDGFLLGQSAGVGRFPGLQGRT